MTDENSGNPRSKAIRCAIYTRKSSEEGLEQEFNSLHAQRDISEAFIASQRHEGWICLPEGYDDGGYSGGSMERPALRRLLDDIRARRVDCVVVYKVDRLSRSMLDFAKMMQTFEQQGISFVSVTQQLNTRTSMGRLILNVLLSFAQFEREMISDRTRDKIAAIRRKGKCHPTPRLGYDVVAGKLVVNHEEAQRVREIFALYLQNRSFSATVRDIRRRGWTSKSWINRNGQRCGGGPINWVPLKSMLSNVIYSGHVRYRDEVHPGQHESIVEPETFREVQQVLKQHQDHWRLLRLGPKYAALLRGLLHCATCDCPMDWAHATRELHRYSYYVCHRATEGGWRACAVPSVAADVVEPFVVEQIERLSGVPTIVAEVCRLSWQASLEQGLARTNGHAYGRHADAIHEPQLRKLWTRFPEHWKSLRRGYHRPLLNQLIERIAHNGPQEKVSITFRPQGVLALAEQLARRAEDSP